MQSISRIPQIAAKCRSGQRTSALVASADVSMMVIVFSCIPSSQSFNMQMGEYSSVNGSVVSFMMEVSRDLSASQGNSSVKVLLRKICFCSRDLLRTVASDLTSSSTSDDSFEKRMRDMVLGNQKQKLLEQRDNSCPGPKIRPQLPPTILPPNA
jgi:hypothetical protein